MFAGLQDLGVANGEDLKETLTNCTEPLKAIEQFQVEPGGGAGWRGRWLGCVSPAGGRGPWEVGGLLSLQVAASLPREGGTGCPELGRRRLRSERFPAFAVTAQPAQLGTSLQLPPCVLSIGVPGQMWLWLRFLLPPGVSKIDLTLALRFLRQRMACCCPPCSRPCPSWTCMGHPGWSSTSRCLMSFGTSCWSGCQPSPPRGRLRRGRWAGAMCGPLPALTVRMSPGVPPAHTTCLGSGR